VVDLLLSAPQVGHIDRQRRAPAPSSNGAAAQRSAASAGSVMLTADLTRLDSELYDCELVRQVPVSWRTPDAASSKSSVVVPLDVTRDCSTTKISEAWHSSAAAHRGRSTVDGPSRQSASCIEQEQGGSESFAV